MVLRIDPDIPLVWRSPTAVQWGVDDPLVVVDDLGPGADRLVAALVKGVSRGAYPLLAAAAGVDEETASRLLHAALPVLQEHRAPRSGWQRVCVLGSNVVARELAALLDDEDRGHPDPADADLIVLSADWVVAPEDHGRWLSRDVTHLPVVTTDRAVTIGPFVVPGRGPCLYCVHRTRVDQDPAWPAIASQLWNRPLPPVPRARLLEAALFTIRHLSEGPPEEPTSWRLGMDGSLRRVVWQRHPECLCSAPQESDWARGERRADPAAPRRGRVVGAHA